MITITESDVRNFLPRVWPAGWRCIDRRPDGFAWLVEPLGVSVIGSVEAHEDRRWLHLSVARRDRLPSWDELKEVKRVLAGPERVAVQVIPRDSEYVNFHAFCLHLFVPLEGEDPLPDFTRGRGIL